MAHRTKPRKAALSSLFPRLDPPIGVMMRMVREESQVTRGQFYTTFGKDYVKRVESGVTLASLEIWNELLDRSKWDNAWAYLRSGLHMSLSIEADALPEIIEAFESLDKDVQADVLKALSGGLCHTPNDLAALLRRSVDLRCQPNAVWFLSVCVAFSDSIENDTDSKFLQ